MKILTIAISSLLLLAMVGAATLEVTSNHVFEGEEFIVKYAANAPLSQQEITVAFVGQTKIISQSAMTVGSFSSEVSFTAPQTGTYEIVSGNARAEVVVEPALLVLKDISIKPSTIAPRETAKLSYTLENVGDLRVYNVKSRVAIPASDQFSYNGDLQELFSEMAAGEKLVQAKEIRARENAAGEANIEVAVTYEYDGELHKRSEWIRLGISSNDWALTGLLAVLIIIVVGFAFSRTLQQRSKRAIAE